MLHHISIFLLCLHSRCLQTKCSHSLATFLSSSPRLVSLSLIHSLLHSSSIPFRYWFFMSFAFIFSDESHSYACRTSCIRSLTLLFISWLDVFTLLFICRLVRNNKALRWIGWRQRNASEIWSVNICECYERSTKKSVLGFPAFFTTRSNGPPIIDQKFFFHLMWDGRKSRRRHETQFFSSPPLNLLQPFSWLLLRVARDGNKADRGRPLLAGN